MLCISVAKRCNTEAHSESRKTTKIFAKIVNGSQACVELFSQKPSSQMFDRFLNTPLQFSKFTFPDRQRCSENWQNLMNGIQVNSKISFLMTISILKLVTYRFSYVIRHNDTNKMTPPPTYYSVRCFQIFNKIDSFLKNVSKCPGQQES